MGFRIDFPKEKITGAIGDAARKLVSDRKTVLNAIGVQILSFSQQDYRVKGRGGKGTDGISWKALAPSTVKAKNRRGKVIGKQKATPSGKVRPPLGGSTEIGVNTGLQRASASPGYKAADSKGGNVFAIAVDSVTVGYGRTYSKYFDAQRQLLPADLPPKWRAACEKLVMDWADRILSDATGGI